MRTYVPSVNNETIIFYKNRSEDDILLDQLFGDTITTEEDYFDANIFESENVAPSRLTSGGSRSTTPPPVFKQCTSLEECLDIDNANPDDEHYLRPLDYHDYMYDYDDAIGSANPARPPIESSFGGSDGDRNNYAPSNNIIPRPSDGVVTRPVFTPDGTLLFEAEKTKSEEKLDRLITSLGSLINLLNTTRDEGM